MKYAIINTIQAVPQKRKMKIVLILAFIFILYLWNEIRMIKKEIIESQKLRYEKELIRLSRQVNHIESILRRQKHNDDCFKRKDTFNEDRLKKTKQKVEMLEKALEELE